MKNGTVRGHEIEPFPAWTRLVKTENVTVTFILFNIVREIIINLNSRFFIKYNNYYARHEIIFVFEYCVLARRRRFSPPPPPPPPPTFPDEIIIIITRRHQLVRNAKYVIIIYYIIAVIFKRKSQRRRVNCIRVFCKYQLYDTRQRSCYLRIKHSQITSVV